ncbi:MAG: PepSY domain-containing protein [Burkholderiales bacterium]|nr:PepSY domain-containing protein [Burkholderiales bacterium]
MAAPAGKARSSWLGFHRWLGLWLGTWFALVGLSGSILVFEDEVDAFLNPGLLTDARPGPWLAPHDMPAHAAEAFPLAHVERLRPPNAPGEVYRLIVRVAPHMRSGSPRVEAMFSPATGELLGSREVGTLGLSKPYLLQTLYEFHRNVLLGNFGSNIVGIAGFLLLASAVTGFAVALPRRLGDWKRLVIVKLRAGATRVLFDVHRSSGALLCALLVLATVTGSTLVYVNYARDIVGVFSEVAPFPTVPWRQAPADDWPTFESILAKVRAAYPGRQMREIHIPSRPTAGYLFYLRGAGDVHRLGDTIVWVHPATGEILFERSPRNRTAGESVMHWLFPLHSGTAFGTPGKIAMCVTGIAPLLLVLTGLWVWSRKRRAVEIESRRRRQSRSGTAEADATGRGLGQGI